MARYTEPLTVRRTELGKRYYSTVTPTTAQEEVFAYQYNSRIGDRWDTLAYKYLGSAALWYVIANANGGANGSIFIKPGSVITIPEK